MKNKRDERCLVMKGYRRKGFKRVAHQVYVKTDEISGELCFYGNKTNATHVEAMRFVGKIETEAGQRWMRNYLGMLEIVKKSKEPSHGEE